MKGSLISVKMAYACHYTTAGPICRGRRQSLLYRMQAMKKAEKDTLSAFE